MPKKYWFCGCIVLSCPCQSLLRGTDLLWCRWCRGCCQCLHPWSTSELPPKLHRQFLCTLTTPSRRHPRLSSPSCPRTVRAQGRPQAPGIWWSPIRNGWIHTPAFLASPRTVSGRDAGCNILVGPSLSADHGSSHTHSLLSFVSLFYVSLSPLACLFFPGSFPVTHLLSKSFVPTPASMRIIQTRNRWAKLKSQLEK